MSKHFHKLIRVVAAGLTLVVGVAFAGTQAQAGEHAAVKPTIVIVHGAFADSSGFGDEIGSLQRLGYTVYAPANPLRGLSGDAAYLRAFLAQANDLGGGHTDLLANVEYRGYPDSGEDADVYIKQASFRAIFAADVPAAKASVMAASQRPVALGALLAPSGVPAWRTVPSWYLVARADKAIPPQAERVMAKRAGAHTVEIGSSHAVMVSHPTAVTALILKAAAR